ncbi:MAG: glucose 1-dehydrogenase [Ruminococcaceae bacterium]|nr:glucose 1-dehydrogenase [Oscillospiraceae bacterium]
MKDIILITGATRGIGRAIAELFLNKGFTVAGIYKESDSLANELVEKFENFVPVKADVSKKEEVERAVSLIYGKFGKIDCLINNAGISEARLLQDETEESYERIFSTNMKGAFLVTKSVLPGMINKKKGKIINISSMWGITGGAMEVLYSASKAALIGFTKALAKEVALSGITVNAVAPGVIKTDMLNSLSEDILSELKEETPLNRLGKPEDIAGVCYFLYSDSADFITGQVVSADGGMVI